MMNRDHHFPDCAERIQSLQNECGHLRAQLASMGEETPAPEMPHVLRDEQKEAVLLAHRRELVGKLAQKGVQHTSNQFRAPSMPGSPPAPSNIAIPTPKSKPSQTKNWTECAIAAKQKGTR